MSGLPQFVTGGTGQIASYDYYDLSARTGYKRFYALVCNEGSKLLTSAIDGNNFKTNTTTTGSPTATKSFDLTFQAPNIVGGTGFIALTYEVFGGSGAGTTSAYTKVTVKKVDIASTVTTIGSQVTTDTVSATGSTWTSRRAQVAIDITRTHFAIGEKLRLEIEFWCTCANPSPQVNFYHDPGNRGTPYNEQYTLAAPRTDIVFDVPFRVVM